MGLPPVAWGLFVSIFLWRNGPFVFLEILYTPQLSSLPQAIIATPIVMGITLAAIQHLPKKSPPPDPGPGGERLQMVWLLMEEGPAAALAAVMAGFGGGNL